MDSINANDYIHHLTEEDLLKFEKEFKEFID